MGDIMDKNKISNFLNIDIAYLLGLITAKGEIHFDNEVKRIVITFKYKSLEAVGIDKNYNQKLHIQTSLDSVVARLQRIGIETSKNIHDNQLTIVLRWHRDDISWQFIKFLINGENFSYHTFNIPETIFYSNNEVKREFIRGFADVTGFVRNSNRDQRGRHRVYLEVDFRNWKLSPQLCEIVQSLGVPVQTINYAHPNFRDPENKKSSTFWKKEHQLKIYADDFSSIGFYITHKQEVLEELAEYNLSNFNCNSNICTGVTRIRRIKPANPNENAEDIPENIRGKHFDSFRVLCRDLNCYQQRNDD